MSTPSPSVASRPALVAAFAGVAMLCAAIAAQAPSQTPVPAPAPRLHLRYATFDPGAESPPIVPALRAHQGQRLGVVQFAGAPTPADRERLAAAGLTVHWYLPHHAYVVRGDLARAAALGSQQLRWSGPLHPAYKLAPAAAAAVANAAPRARWLVVMVDPRRDEAAATAAIARADGTIWRHAAGNLLLEADLDGAGVLALAHDDSVLWLEPATAAGFDMDNARRQGGADRIEALAGHTGKGVRGHVLEGVHTTHPEFAANAWRTAPTVLFSNVPSAHGTSVFATVFANGTAPAARGVCPDGQGFCTDAGWLAATPPMSTGSNSRYGVVRELVDPAQPWLALFQVAAWGHAHTTGYDARSAEIDFVIHQLDMPICQSTSNLALAGARPQAWAKNVISVGGIVHHDTASPHDDTAGQGVGPASDGRIKPDLCAYGDAIFTTDGPAGYTAQFAGASGAVGIAGGYLGLALELFTDGAFGHVPAPTWQQRFDYRPHAATAKALLLNTARPYDPAVNGIATARRGTQGWGFPAIDALHRQQRAMLVLDELDFLQQGQTRSYHVFVKPQTRELRVTTTWVDPPASPAALLSRVNDLDLRVTSPAGAVYHGNHGLKSDPVQLFSAPGGSADGVDTVENVFVAAPAPGVWRVDVHASLVVIDQMLLSAAVDTDFALVVNGIGGGRDAASPQLDLTSAAPGQLALAIAGVPANWTDGFVLFALAGPRPVAMGAWLGIEPDALTGLSAASPAVAGSPLHFVPGGASQFPQAPFVFPAWIAQAFQGQTLDAVAMWRDAGGNVLAVSTVDRVTVQ